MMPAERFEQRKNDKKQCHSQHTNDNKMQFLIRKHRLIRIIQRHKHIMNPGHFLYNII